MVVCNTGGISKVAHTSTVASRCTLPRNLTAMMLLQTGQRPVFLFSSGIMAPVKDAGMSVFLSI